MSLPALLLRWLLPFALLPPQRLKLGQLACFATAAALIAAQRLQQPVPGGGGTSAAFCVIGGAEALFETCSLALFVRSIAKAASSGTAPTGWLLNALALAFVHSGLVHRCGCEGAGGAGGADAAAAAAEVCRAEDAASMLEAATSSVVLRALAKALTRNYRHACAATCAVTSWTG
jgi:hypothetical protein